MRQILLALAITYVGMIAVAALVHPVNEEDQCEDGTSYVVPNPFPGPRLLCLNEPTPYYGVAYYVGVIAGAN